jgi:FtsP/CotA-like multicopper oxidase with cupredoxin domain
MTASLVAARRSRRTTRVMLAIGLVCWLTAALAQWQIMRVPDGWVRVRGSVSDILAASDDGETVYAVSVDGREVETRARRTVTLYEDLDVGEEVEVTVQSGSGAYRIVGEDRIMTDVLGVVGALILVAGLLRAITRD